jgi:hypothetical protein
MPKLILALVACLAIALLAVACDDDGGPATSPTPEATATAQAQATADAQATPSDGDEETPEPERTPQAIAPPADVSEYLAQYEDDTILQSNCDYDPSLGVVDCGEHGLYAVNPLPTDPAADCDVLLVDDQPVAVACTLQEPLTVVYYAVE